nr:hypothetical protein [Tanacetum cinerariifolium]GEX45794.1 hypothetical protein [Tanacetum cinerariifolium]
MSLVSLIVASLGEKRISFAAFQEVGKHVESLNVEDLGINMIHEIYMQRNAVMKVLIIEYKRIASGEKHKHLQMNNASDTTMVIA